MQMSEASRKYPFSTYPVTIVLIYETKRFFLKFYSLKSRHAVATKRQKHSFNMAKFAAQVDKTEQILTLDDCRPSERSP